MSVVYIVEDDITLRDELSNLLNREGYTTRVCDDFENAASKAIEANPDCVILDLGLPGADGREICRDIHQSSDVPIIVLTAAGDEFTEVMTLGLGAHDFIAKPYRPAVLLARVDSHIRRTAPRVNSGSILECQGVALDQSVSRLTYEGKSVELTRNEQRILSLLMSNAGTIISRQEIMCELWESDSFIDDNTLTVNVNRLRKVLESLGVPDSFLQTRRAQGYIVGNIDK